MTLILESDNLADYLGEIPPIIVFSTPLVKEKINWIKEQRKTPFERAKLAFEIARDEIHHSFDTKSGLVTVTGEEALEKKEGICFAKSHLLATLLRGMGIPTGFCYQSVLKKGTVESGLALHGLNAVYLEEFGWFRVDPRGNKPGVNSQFSPEKEQLAYPIRTEWGEIDYPNIFTKPLNEVIAGMRKSTDFQTLFDNRPSKI